MDVPTAADIRRWSLLDFEEAGYPAPPPPPADDRLQLQVDRAVDYVKAVTGQPISASTPDPLVPMLQQVVQLRSEQLVVQATDDYQQAAADDVLQSFSVTGYSENRRQIGEQFRKGATGRPVINSHPQLNDMLWLLMTEERQEFWLFFLLGKFPPAFDVTEIDWREHFWPQPIEEYPWLALGGGYYGGY